MKENPFTKVPNAILDLESLNVYEFRILMHIYRKTIGFNKKSDGISLSQFQKATGISKPTILKSLKNLEEMKLIKVQKQINKAGGKSFNRYLPLVKEIDYLVKEIYKGSKGDLPPLVKEIDIQKKIEQKKIDKRRERTLIGGKENILFQLEENEQNKEIDFYISHVIKNTEYIKSPTGFRRSIKKKLMKEDELQLEDFEKYYLEKTCRKYEENFTGKYIEEDEISNIYPYFDTDKNEPSDKFIIWFNKDEEEYSFTKSFTNKKDIEEMLRGAN